VTIGDCRSITQNRYRKEGSEGTALSRSGPL
jgi:hypothetical protein